MFLFKTRINIRERLGGTVGLVSHLVSSHGLEIEPQSQHRVCLEFLSPATPAPLPPLSLK